MAAVRETREVRRRALPREGVGEIQRARITTAMGELVRERGASGVTVAHIVARSGVSRRTFYELFDDREDCFVAAFDRALAKGASAVGPAYESADAWRERVRAALHALLDFLDQEPVLGYLCVVGSLSAGPRGLDRRARATAAIVAALHQGRRESRAARRPDRLVAEGLVGAVLAILASRLQDDTRPPLVGLLNSLMAMIVLPYLDAEAAEQELRRATPRARKTPNRHEDPLRGLEMRLTYRTIRVLLAIASHPASSNRQVGQEAGVADQGQISKLLARLHVLGLIENAGGDHAKGEPNAWSLTSKGWGIAQTLQARAA
jgi:AcrR family transcriptional regulator